MGRTITLTVARQVLAEIEQSNESYRSLAERHRMSRGTIAAIASGEWFVGYYERRAKRQQREAELRRFDVTDRPGRCPVCRRWMAIPVAGWPCIACRIERLPRSPGGHDTHADDDMRSQLPPGAEARKRSVTATPTPPGG